MLYLLDCYMNVYVEHTLTFSIQILNRLSAGACGTFFFSQTLLLRVYIQYIYIYSLQSVPVQCSKTQGFKGGTLMGVIHSIPTVAAVEPRNLTYGLLFQSAL